MGEITDILECAEELYPLKAMLPPWIIEQIRKREEERPKDDRPALRLPFDEQEPDYRRREYPDKEDENRGVVILDLCGYSLLRHN